MKQMNIKKYISKFLLLVLGVLMYSCTEDNLVPDTGDGSGDRLSLSVLLNAPQQNTVRVSGNPDKDAESKIYSLEVVVFKSIGEHEAGKLDGYGCVTRETRSVTGETYDKEYIEIDEIKDVKVTAGKRDIYVVANAPDSCFKSVQTIQDFLSIYEKLSTQGRSPHPGNVTPDPNEELPIGGINPSNLKTNLTMCNYLENAVFSNKHNHHYLGYTGNDGLPAGVNPNDGYALKGNNPFLIERLVARVAVQKIEFDLTGRRLPFEGGSYPSSDFTYQIDSVFMMNVKTTSKFGAGSQLGFTEIFGHGCKVGYSFLNDNTTKDRIKNLHQQSQYTDFLAEAITTPNYDISKNATPLWFYAFENQDSDFPTYLVIGVRYNFRSTKDRLIKTVKTYYPVIVNEDKTGKLADHNYIKRNNQYQITVVIKGLGSMYGENPTLLKSLQVTDQDIEVTETVGRNLFPWTGDIY